MYELLWNEWLRRAAVLAGSILVLTPAIAWNQIASANPDLRTSASVTPMAKKEFIPGNDSLAQVNSVSQLRDVQPTDWAFGALRSLVERYGCIAGYPDGTYRGNQAITRYEFAAGLNACLEQIIQLRGNSANTGVTREELAVPLNQFEQLRQELGDLDNRLDGLESPNQ